MSIESVMPSSHLILCRLLLLLPPIPPSIRVFSNESTLHMRWPKYWSFSLNISPSNEHPGLISLRMDWLDLLGWHYFHQPSFQVRKLRFRKVMGWVQSPQSWWVMALGLDPQYPTQGVFFLASLCSIWDFSSLTRDWIQPPCLEAWSLNHWIIGEALDSSLF